jgi:hypothetical protein
MIGLFGDGSVGSPSVPVQIGGTVGRHTDGQDAAWQTLVLMLGLGLILGSAVLMYVVVQRSRTLARRRARAALAMHGAEHAVDGGIRGGTNGSTNGGTDGSTDGGIYTRTAQPEPERHSEEVPDSQRQSPTESPATPEPESSGRQPPEPVAAQDASTAEASTSDATATPTTAAVAATTTAAATPTAATTTTPTTTAANPRHHRRPRVTA